MQVSSDLTFHAGTATRTGRQALLNQKGTILWMTGLSGSGKSTIACLLEQLLLERNKLAYRLDGDNIRLGLNRNLGFSAEDRTENIRRISEVARLFLDAGVIVITAFISPYREDRQAARALVPAGDFVEVHVDATLETAERRDPKGLYKKARAGLIKGFTGIDDPYEPPTAAEITIDTQHHTADEAARQILLYLETRGYLQA